MTMVKRCEWAVGSEDAHQWPECDQTASCFLVINWMKIMMKMKMHCRWWWWWWWCRWWRRWWWWWAYGSVKSWIWFNRLWGWEGKLMSWWPGWWRGRGWWWGWWPGWWWGQQWYGWGILIEDAGQWQPITGQSASWQLLPAQPQLVKKQQYYQYYQKPTVLSVLSKTNSIIKTNSFIMSNSKNCLFVTPHH